MTGPPGEYEICFLSEPIGSSGYRMAALPVFFTAV